MPIYKGSTPVSKNTTLNWQAAFPDWSRREIKATNTTHTAAKYGYVLFRNVNYTDSLTGYLNGATVFRQHGSYGNFEDWNSLLFPVVPGNTYMLSGGEVSFIPAIGN